MSDAVVELAGETVRLLPERALWWPRAEALLVADLHWGKDATFAAHGVPLPAGTTGSDLARLDRALARTGARTLVILGDLLHARPGRVAPLFDALAEWRAAHAALEVVAVRGNHDRHAGDPPASLRIAVEDGPVSMPPFALRHEPEPGRHESAYVLGGHLHPVMRLAGPARLRERLPCFLLGPRVGVLPAFSEFTGGHDVRPRPGDRAWVVAGDEVVPIHATPFASPTR
jgi:DNA ligase-associated metallophosphoesterase